MTSVGTNFEKDVAADSLSGKEKEIEGPVEGFLDSIRNKVKCLNLFTDHTKYGTASGQSIAREISSLLEEEVSALGVLVERFWQSGEGDVASSRKGKLVHLLSTTSKGAYVDPSTGDLMSVDEALEYVQRGIAAEKRIVPLRSVCESLDRLSKEVAALSNMPQTDAGDHSRLAAVLATRDQQRHALVQEWVEVTTLTFRIERARGDGLPGLQAIRDGIRNLESAMVQHQRIIVAFPLPRAPSDRVGELAKGDETTHLLPYQLADRFVEEFNLSVIAPAVEAQTDWKHLVEKLQLRKRHRTPVSPADEAKVAAAEGKSIEAAIQLREQYDEWIPLLRFGFPELRGKISSLVDEHCGLGSLRMDISPSDFEWIQLTPSGAGATAFQAVSKSVARQSKGLSSEYCIKRFSNADDYFRELEAMRAARNSDGTHHLNVGEVEFSFEEGTGEHRVCFIAMPLYPMSTQKWFATHGASLANMKDVIRVLCEIVSGLACLHSHGILHGDLKPDNIMMDGTGVGARPKLIDFNFSTVRTAGSTNVLRIVTAPLGVSINFAPPEFLDPRQERTTESDVYSLGRTFGALLQDNILLSPVWKGQLITQWLQQLIKAMTNPSPENRPHLSKVSTASGGAFATISDRLRSLNKIVGILSPSPSDITALQYLDALNGNIRFSFEWYGLGFVMQEDENVTVGGTSYTKQQCYVEALKQDPKDTFTWYSLGLSLEETEEVQVNDGHFNQRQCYVEVLKHDPEFSAAWSNLGACMDATEEVRINGTGYDKRQCYVEAQRHEPKGSDTQANPPPESTSFVDEQLNVSGGADYDSNSPPESPSVAKSNELGESMFGSTVGDALETRTSSFSQSASLNVTKSAVPAPLSQPQQSGEIAVGGDLPLVAPVGNLPLHITIPIEPRRDSQLRLQNNQCAKCEALFPAGAIASALQKPRRCHYCCALYCHNCHINKTMILPFNVFHQWDFTFRNVCNGCYDFLSANTDRPLYSLKQLPKDLQTRPSIVAAVKLRKHLVALNRVVAECRDIPKSLNPFRESRYCTQEDYFSLADFIRLRGGDSTLAAMEQRGMVLGSQEDLVTVLASMFKKMKHHVTDCPSCNARAVARCLICDEAKPVMVFEEDGMSCPKCGTIYHKGCFDAIGCKKCNH